MNNIIFAVLILFGCFSAFAQEKLISPTELETLLTNSREKLKGKPYRLTLLTKSSVEGRPETDFLSKSVIEFVSPTISRSMLESTFKLETKKSEIIRLGDKVYTRPADGNWQEKAYEADVKKMSNRLVAENQTETQTEYKYIGIEKLNNQDTRLYTKIVKSKSINKATDQEKSSISTTRYWFNEDDMLLKMDMNMKSHYDAKIFHTSVEQIWALDSNINIEAPKMVLPSK